MQATEIYTHEKEPRFAIKRWPQGRVLEGIWRLMQDAYTVEARLIDCDDFPPLSRSRHDIHRSSSTFYTAHDQNNLLLGVLELEQEGDSATIDSLCVTPTHFRQGIGRLLIGHILGQAHATVRVSTAALNAPAGTLYLSMGFVKVGESKKGNIRLHHFEWRSPER